MKLGGVFAQTVCPYPDPPANTRMRALAGMSRPRGAPIVTRARREIKSHGPGEAWKTRGPTANLDVMTSQSPDKEPVLSICAVHPEAKRMWRFPFASEGNKVVIGKPFTGEGLTPSGTISQERM